MSLATTLYNSKKYVPGPEITTRFGTEAGAGTFVYESEVADLVRKLEKTAAAKGLTVSRWQANKSGRKVTITWAIHRGARAEQFRRMAEGDVIDYAILDQLEGTTTRCEAYRELSHLLQVLEAQ